MGLPDPWNHVRRRTSAPLVPPRCTSRRRSTFSVLSQNPGPFHTLGRCAVGKSCQSPGALERPSLAFGILFFCIRFTAGGSSCTSASGIPLVLFGARIATAEVLSGNRLEFSVHRMFQPDIPMRAQKYVPRGTCHPRRQEPWLPNPVQCGLKVEPVFFFNLEFFLRVTTSFSTYLM